MSIRYTKRALADIAGYSYRRLHDIDMKLADGDKLYVETDDGYDINIFVRNWVKYNVERERNGREEDLDAVRAAHEHVKMEKSQLTLAKMRGELVLVEDVHALWASIVTRVQQNLLVIPKKLAPRLTRLKSVEEVHDMIDAEIRTSLTLISETPLPDAEGARETDDAEEDGAEQEK